MGVKELLKQKQKELNGNSVEYPLTKVSIDQLKGQFRIGGTKNQETGEWEDARYVDVLEIIVFDRYSDYFKFDPEKEKIVFWSTIEKNPKDCKDRYSDVTVAEMKEAGDDLTFLMHLVGITPDGEEIDFTLKGVGVKEFLGFLRKENYWKNRLVNKLRVSLKPEKKGVVSYFVPEFEMVEINEEEAKLVLQKVDKVLEKYEEFRAIYNNPNPEKGKTSEEIVEEVETEDFEDGDLPF